MLNLGKLRGRVVGAPQAHGRDSVPSDAVGAVAAHNAEVPSDAVGAVTAHNVEAPSDAAGAATTHAAEASPSSASGATDSETKRTQQRAARCPHHAGPSPSSTDRLDGAPKRGESGATEARKLGSRHAPQRSATELPRVPIHRLPGVLRALQRGPIPFAQAALAGVDAAGVWLPVGHFGVPGLHRAIPMSRTLVVRDARFAREVHTSPDFERGFAFREVARLLGDSLLTLDGDAHRALRKAFASHFAPRTLDGYQEQLESAFAPLSDAWKGATHSDQTVNVSEALCCANLSFVCGALFSARPSTETLLALDSALRTCDRAAYTMRLSPINRSTHEFDRALTSLQAFAASLVESRLGARSAARSAVQVEACSGALPAGDFLDRLLSADIEVYDAAGRVVSTRRLTREEVRDEVLDMLLAGYSTTTGAMSFMFDQLARNPKVQYQLRSLNRIARTSGKSERVQDFRDAIWTETVRMFPAAVMSPRQARLDTEVHGARVPRGTLALIVPYVSQRDAKHWPEPETFNPDRHLGPGARAKLKQDLVAFGHGVHACIGRELSRRMACAALSTLGDDFVLAPSGREAKPAGFMLMAPHADVHVHVRAFGLSA